MFLHTKSRLVHEIYVYVYIYISERVIEKYRFESLCKELANLLADFEPCTNRVNSKFQSKLWIVPERPSFWVQDNCLPNLENHHFI